MANSEGPINGIQLDPHQFRNWISRVKVQISEWGSFLHVIVLSGHMEGIIMAAMLNGSFNDGFVNHYKDQNGRLCMYAGGVKLRFADSLTPGRSLFVLSKSPGYNPLNVPENKATWES